MTCFFFSFLLTIFTDVAPPAEVPPMLYHSNNQGAAWERFDEGLPDGAVPRTITVADQDLWLVTDSDGLFILPAGENTWVPRSGNLPKTVFATSFIVEGDLLALGTYQEGVWISRDGGQHWYRSVFNLQNNAVWSLAFKDGVMLAGTNRGVYRSYDGGISWVGDEADYFQVNDLLDHDGKLFAARRDGIYVSTNRGDSWTQIFTDHPVYDLTVSDNHLYAAGGSVVLRSDNGGKTWQKPGKSNSADTYNSVPEAHWRGIKINTPQDRSARQIFETERGWFIGISPGC